MKRLVPLWICALGGFVLIVAYFSPWTQDWGEVAAIWFDILAAIAFVLGGGNLLKMHLKAASDKKKGWGYSLITVISFIVMLYVGLAKFGAPPAPNQEFFGETFAHVPVTSIPDAVVARVEGAIPERAVHHPLHHSVRAQIGEENGEITFRGWMRKGQKSQLLRHRDILEWQCAIEKLFEESQPSGVLAGAVAYYADHQALSFTGSMTEEQKQALLDLDGDESWQTAVNELFDKTMVTTRVTMPDNGLPPLFDAGNPGKDLVFDPTTREMTVTGPLTNGQKDGLNDVFAVARPLDSGQRQVLLDRIRDAGPLQPAQQAVFTRVLDGSWTRAQLVDTVQAAGAVEEEDRTACEMLVDQEAGVVANIPLKKTVGENLRLTPGQIAAIDAYIADPAMTIDGLVERMEANGAFKRAQADAARAFLGSAPTVGERGKQLAFAMMKVTDESGAALPLNAAQRDLLLKGNRDQIAWIRGVGELFISAHVVKNSWSGEYRAQGAPFWWLYEFAFKPLQATIFAMLAFYVASAAFRAFRAKNIEAFLLLGTAFIILLGRTFAGVFLTSWVPEWASGLKIENLTVYIMQVFNTAGNRAIMIGIALGIASTSLKVLLGVDRSYLGSGEE
ncbi:MAG: hypothetical protein GY715_18925 [Planctomycetes bacterium]|nr:hypothetical protein [Planctomycetota bacterium]